VFLYNRLGANVMRLVRVYVHVCVCVGVWGVGRSGIMRERRGKEKLVEKMRWRRMMKFG